MRAKIQTGGQLTLDQLRKINDEPVWVEDFGDAKRSGWKLIHWDRNKYIAFVGVNPSAFLVEEYGETWAAYKYKPESYEDTHKACEFCKMASSIWGHAIVISRWGGTEENYSGELGFCPKCGRPMPHENAGFDDVIELAGKEVLDEGHWIEYADPDRNAIRNRSIAEKIADKIPSRFAEIYGYEMPFRVAPENAYSSETVGVKILYDSEEE